MRVPVRATAVALLTAAAALAPAAAEAPAQEPTARVVASPSVVVPATVEPPITPVEVRAVPAKAAPVDLLARAAEERRWVSPVEGRLTSGYGVRVHPISGAVHEHRGIDLAAPIGTPVRAPHRATVVETGGCQSGCVQHSVYGITGYYVVLEHGDGVVTTFNHLLSADGVAVGQRVKAGHVIGHIGMSGETTGPHLHLQALVGGAFVDPEPFFAERG